jgi:hypothetical protein
MMVRRIAAIAALLALGVFPALAVHIRAMSGSHCSRSKHSCCCKKAAGETTVGAKSSCCGHCTLSAPAPIQGNIAPESRAIATIDAFGSAAAIGGTSVSSVAKPSPRYQRPPPSSVL